MKLLSFNYQATELQGVLSSHITIHLSALRLQQHGTEELSMMARVSLHQEFIREGAILMTFLT